MWRDVPAERIQTVLSLLMGERELIRMRIMGYRLVGKRIDLCDKYDLRMIVMLFSWWHSVPDHVELLHLRPADQ